MSKKIARISFDFGAYGSVAECAKRDRVTMEKSGDTPQMLDAAIKANLGALADLLERAAKDAREARDHADANERNMAIGMIADLDGLLADAVALHGAALALHRRARL